MAANGERASRREFITAVVAIVVGGLVSLAGVVVGCQSSRDAQRTAREAQRETARAERERADLTELRSVLDTAAADLQRLNDRARDAAYYLGRGSKPLAPVRSAYRATERSRLRLVIRLGARAKAVKFFREALEIYVDAAETDIGKAEPVFERGERAAGRYYAEARRPVGSRVPGG